MNVPIVRQHKIELDLSDQYNIALNLFNTILKTATTQTKIKHSWAAIKQDINIQEYLEARQRQLRNIP